MLFLDGVLTGSAICTSPSGRVVELYEARNVEKAKAAGWKVQTAMAYLTELSEAISKSALRDGRS